MWFTWSQSDQSRQVIDINQWTLNITTSWNWEETWRNHLIPLLINISLLPKYLSTSTYTWCRTSLPPPVTSICRSGKHCNSNGGSNHLLLTFECDDNLIGKEKSNHTASCLALHYFAFPSQSHAHLPSNRHETCPPQRHQANRIKQPVPRHKKLWKHENTHGHCVRNISISYYTVSLQQGWGHDNLPRAFRCRLWRQEANQVGTPCRQWEFQDPKLEVLYHIRPYFVVIFPYIGLI